MTSLEGRSSRADVSRADVLAGRAVSTIRDPTAPSDVDVLLIYAAGDLSRGHDLPETIRELPLAEIHDVLALSESEEAS
jgi:hypothetical protein